MAAEKFESAARRLFWKDGLWEAAGIAALDAGDLDNAVDNLEIARSKSALSDAGWLALGSAYANRSDFPAAIASWQNAPAYPEAIANTARAQRSLGFLAAARQSWEALIRLDVENSEAHYQLGLLMVVEDPNAALVEFMHASEDPVYTPATDNLRTDINIALLSENEPYRLVLLGRSLAAQGSWDLAVIAFDRALGLQSDFVPALAWMGEAQQHLDGEALPFLQQAIEADPQSAMSHILYGTYWQRLGRKQSAVDAFENAVQLEPEVAAWHLALGSAYEKNGQLSPALSEYRAVVDLDPLYEDGWRALALYAVYNQYDLGKTGVTAARQLLELDPNDWMNWDIVGQVTLSLGNLLEAQHAFEQAILLEPTEPAPHYHLALVHLQNNYFIEAIQELEQVIDLDQQGQYSWQAERILEDIK